MAEVKNMSIHDGHRERLKNRFLKEGLDNFDDLQVLELLLFYCIPRRDTNPLAHALKDRFGSLSGVLQATPEELKSVNGLGDSAATFLPLVGALARRYYTDKAGQEDILRSIEECGSYIEPHFINRRNETVVILCLDAKCKVKCCRVVDEGNVNSASVPIQKILKIAMANDASTVVLAHNHPSGLALPSAEDIQTTIRVATALSAVDIQLLDHLVFADGDYVSMAQSGYYCFEDCRI